MRDTLIGGEDDGRTSGRTFDVYQNKSINRAFMILEILCDHPSGLAASEVAENCNLHRATAHRFLEVLRAKGYVAKAKRTGRYTIGFRLGRFGNKSLIVQRVLVHSRSRSLRLAHETSSVVSFGTLRGFHAVTHEKFIGEHAIVPKPPPGEIVGAHASALGKALLYLQSPQYIWRSLKGVTLERYTDQTRTDAKQLVNELANMRGLEYATEEEELVEGFSSVAVPLLNPAGRATVAISVMLPARQLKTAKQQAAIARKLSAAAQEIVESVVDLAAVPNPDFE